MTFKEKLVRLRKIKGLTQDEFAKAVGVSRQAVYKWESGQSYPEVAKLLEIKVLFSISIDDLLDDSYEVALPEKKRKRKAVAEKTVEEVTVKEEITPPAQENESVATEKEEATVAVATEQKSAEAQPSVDEEALLEKAEEDSDESKKKVGFFGRLFGRK